MSENIPPRKVYDAAMAQRSMVRSHLPRVVERVQRYSMGSWERSIQDLELRRWQFLCDVLDAICDGKTVQPS
jgi:hypothetical protein